MKKLYITTFQDADNYGASLQCYALSHYLKKKYPVEVINYDNKIVTEQYELIRKKVKNPIKTLYHYVTDIINYKDSKKRKSSFEEFRKNIPMTQRIKSTSELNVDKEDIFIAGSDQIWNPKITLKLDDVYFLKFGNKCKKIAYAASSGDTATLSSYKDEFIKNISSFHAVSVREKSLAEYINKNTKLNSIVTIDPTLLLSKDEWENVITSNRIIQDKYIFVYSVDNSNELFCKSVKDIANKTGYQVVYFEKRKLHNKYRIKGKRWYKAGPEAFLNLLMNAECVVTTSFHGVALSTIFNKKLYIVLSTYPDRILTLVNSVGLNDRIIKKQSDINVLIEKDIDWIKVNKKLDELKNTSTNWLMNSIEK